MRELLLGIGDEEGILRFGMRHRRREMGRYRIGPLRQRLAVSLPGPRSEARALEQARPQEAGNEIIGIGPERTRDRLQGRIDVARRAAHGGELHPRSDEHTYDLQTLMRN